MVDLHVTLLPVSVEGLRDELLLAPVDVPVVVLRLPVLTALERSEYAVREESLEGEFGATSDAALLMHGIILLPNVLTEVFAHRR